jgi:hypothetical protein
VTCFHRHSFHCIASAVAKGNTGEIRVIRPGILPFSVELERLTPILPDIVCAYGPPATGIGSCLSFDCANLPAEEEVHGDDAGEECEGGIQFIVIAGNHSMVKSRVE